MLREPEWGSQQGPVVGSRMGVLSIHPEARLGELSGFAGSSEGLWVPQAQCYPEFNQQELVKHWAAPKTCPGLPSQFSRVGHYISVLESCLVS